MMDESYGKGGGGDPPSYAETGADYTSTTTHTHTTTQSASLGLNKDYVKSIPGILKLVQAVCSLACLISSSIYIGAAAGWCAFVAGWVFFFSLVWFFLYLFNLVSKIPPIRILIEWVYYLVLGILFLVSSILAAAYAANAAGMGAYAFFGFIATAALIVDLVLQFKVWRTEGHTVTTHTTTTTTTTATGTTSTSEVRY